uniref:Guanylate cyclase n=1 Tax=Mesocestoides corti TaxID=53468 RepID=A0A5K3EU45_MESCO
RPHNTFQHFDFSQTVSLTNTLFRLSLSGFGVVTAPSIEPCDWFLRSCVHLTGGFIQCPDHEDICPATLTRMALDIAEGLAYLHSKQLIHRDIACRNCLVGPDHVVKVGDFGLTREATAGSPYGYYRFTRNVELPIRWMPPEAVQFGIFSVKSDLWSYGIVLYEIITFGMFPYVELGDVEVVERVKRSEFSITQILPPAANGTTVWRLIVSCCQYYWQHRPESMLQVIEEIRANGNCIRPYLTDEPPTLETTAIPFLPGPAACIMPEPPSVPQPAFSAPMGARAWVGGAPFMNPSAPFTDPPSMGDGQRHTAANGSGGGGGGACVVEGHKVSPSANSSASLTSNSSKPCNFPPPITVGQSPPRRVQPPMSVYAPPGPPSYQPLDEFRPLLNPTNRSLSLEFLQKSAFHVHSRPPSFLKGNADENTSDGDEDTEAGDVLSPGRGTSHQCTSCPQKTSLVTRNIPPPTPDAVVGPAGRRHHGNFFARTFAAALDSCSKPHPRRSAGLPSFLRGDQASSMRLRLLPSLRHHQPPPSRNELASKSLPQVSGANCHTTKPSCGGVRTSSTGGRTGAGSRIACSSAGDAHLLARPTLSDSSSSANRRPSPSTVTQNGAAGIVISGSSPNFAYHPPPPDSLV